MGCDEPITGSQVGVTGMGGCAEELVGDGGASCRGGRPPEVDQDRNAGGIAGRGAQGSRRTLADGGTVIARASSWPAAGGGSGREVLEQLGVDLARVVHGSRARSPAWTAASSEGPAGLEPGAPAASYPCCWGLSDLSPVAIWSRFLPRCLARSPRCMVRPARGERVMWVDPDRRSARRRPRWRRSAAPGRRGGPGRSGRSTAFDHARPPLAWDRRPPHRGVPPAL